MAEADNYPEHLKHLAPTEEDLDLVVEQATGKLVDKGSAQANAEALRRRLTQLETERAKLVKRYEAGAAVGHFIATADRDLETARALLAGYELQLRQSN